MTRLARATELRRLLRLCLSVRSAEPWLFAGEAFARTDVASGLRR